LFVDRYFIDLLCNVKCLFDKEKSISLSGRASLGERFAFWFFFLNISHSSFWCYTERCFLLL